jgi:hypothetical protein
MIISRSPRPYDLSSHEGRPWKRPAHLDGAHHKTGQTGETGGMKPPPSPHYRHRFPAESISHAVWLYHMFSVSRRDVELLLAERRIVVSHETIRQWCEKFGQTFANRLRRRWPRPRDKSHTVEQVVCRLGHPESGCHGHRGRASHRGRHGPSRRYPPARSAWPGKQPPGGVGRDGGACRPASTRWVVPDTDRCVYAVRC